VEGRGFSEESGARRASGGQAVEEKGGAASKGAQKSLKKSAKLRTIRQKEKLKEKEKSYGGEKKIPPAIKGGGTSTLGGKKDIKTAQWPWYRNSRP